MSLLAFLAQFLEYKNINEAMHMMVPDEMLYFLKTTKVTTLNKCLNLMMKWNGKTLNIKLLERFRFAKCVI